MKTKTNKNADVEFVTATVKCKKRGSKFSSLCECKKC